MEIKEIQGTTRLIVLGLMPVSVAFQLNNGSSFPISIIPCWGWGGKLVISDTYIHFGSSRQIPHLKPGLEVIFVIKNAHPQAGVRTYDLWICMLVLTLCHVTFFGWRGTVRWADQRNGEIGMVNYKKAGMDQRM